MKANEVLKILGVSRRTLSRYCTKGIIKYTVKPNGKYDYNEASVRSLANCGHSHSLFEIMMQVCRMGMLRKNKEELARLEGYKTAWEAYNDGEMTIYNDCIIGRIYIAPNKLSEEIDLTIDVLSALYEPSDEDWEDYNLENYFYEQYCYMKKLKGE